MVSEHFGSFLTPITVTKNQYLKTLLRPHPSMTSYLNKDKFFLLLKVRLPLTLMMLMKALLSAARPDPGIQLPVPLYSEENQADVPTQPRRWSGVTLHLFPWQRAPATLSKPHQSETFKASSPRPAQMVLENEMDDAKNQWEEESLRGQFLLRFSELRVTQNILVSVICRLLI